jgi:excisionase family DNA binding protein
MSAESVTKSSSDLSILKPSEVASLLRVSRAWIYQAAADGRLPSIRLGDAAGAPLRFVREDIEAWIADARGGAS